jgi:hypothetical protein
MDVTLLPTAQPWVEGVHRMPTNWAYTSVGTRDPLQACDPKPSVLTAFRPTRLVGPSGNQRPVNTPMPAVSALKIYRLRRSYCVTTPGGTQQTRPGWEPHHRRWWGRWEGDIFVYSFSVTALPGRR